MPHKEHRTFLGALNRRFRRNPPSPGEDIDNLLVDDTNNDNYLIDDTNTDVHLLQDA